MCLAYPGKIRSIKNDLAVVNFDGIEKEVNVSLVNAKKGDYVIVHAGFAIEVMDKKTGKEGQKIFKSDENTTETD